MIDRPVVEVDINGNGFVSILVRDISKDSGAGNVPGAPPAAGLPHNFEFTVTPLVADPGWTVGTPAPVQLRGGEQTTVQAPFAVIGATRAETYIVNLTTTFRPLMAGDPQVRYATIGAKTSGLPTFVATVKDTLQLQPRDSGQIRIEIQHFGLFEQTYELELVDNPCGLTVVLPTGLYVGPKGVTTALVELKTPWREKLWYLSESCGLGIKVYPTGGEDLVSNTVVATVQVNGQSIFHIEKLFPVFVLLVVLLIILLLIARRKARIEEEILGKPQKPWLIPVEALYLRALRQKDERAWYVVRHHLMEEEYRSSLLWYKSYKKATKGSRKKETLVLRQEKKYNRWKAKWQKRIDAPLLEADKFEAKLQKKLDRRTRKADRKQEKKAETVVHKMEAAHAKKVERALEAWQKQVRKAEKKGLEPPERPEVPEPDYPEMPEPTRVLLADHKWARKAERFRARRVKEQGDLEVKFEKADARKLAKLRRKVQRLARKLDDPAFIDEHPLLRADA